MREALLSRSINDAGEPSTASSPRGAVAEKPKPARERLECLDAVRGLNVIVMMFVDNAGDVDEYWIDHSPWWGIHLADFVMPLFLFMVGVSMAFSMKKYGGPGLKWKVASRTLKLFVLGCLTQGADIFQGGVGIDMAHMRIPGILQRIAWAYMVVSMMKMWLPVYTASSGFVAASIGKWEDAPRNSWALFSHYALHWLVAFAFFFLYVAVMLFAHVPSWTFVKPAHYDDSPTCDTEMRNGSKVQVCTAEWIPEQTYHTHCDTHGDLTPKCSALRMVDTWLLGPHHMYDGGEFERSHWCSACPPLDDSDGCPLPTRPGWCHARLDPEGVLSSMPTVLTTWLGLHFGLVLVHHPSVSYRLQHWGVLSTIFFALGWVISPFCK
jgi:heparan-alpha-glucosaminide N-acetyltransferase